MNDSGECSELLPFISLSPIHILFHSLDLHSNANTRSYSLWRIATDPYTCMPKEILCGSSQPAMTILTLDPCRQGTRHSKGIPLRFTFRNAVRDASPYFLCVHRLTPKTYWDGP